MQELDVSSYVALNYGDGSLWDFLHLLIHRFHHVV